MIIVVGMGWRNIIVDGVTYTWAAGRGGVKARTPTKTVFAMSIEEFKGCTPDDVDRAHYKKWGDGSVASVWPSEVAAMIRKKR